MSQRKRFDRLIVMLMTGKAIDPTDILDVIKMSKDNDHREEFLNSLFANAPCERLPLQSYVVLSDILRAMLRECNNYEDYKSVQRIFNCSNLYSFKKDGIAVPLKCAFASHEVWNNPNFWLYCTYELVAKDVEKWSSYLSISFDFLSIDECEVNAMLAINRIQAVLLSMRSVNIGEDVKEAFIKGTLDAFGLTSAGVNILRPPTERFIAWLLDVALVHREEMMELLDKETSVHVNSRPKSAEVGYCPLQEILFYVADKLVGAPARPSCAMNCVCGVALGGWQPLGIFERAFAVRSNLPCILCEGCYRHILSSPVTSNGSFIEVKRCVVPMTEPEPPTSFSSVFYGHGTPEQKLADSLIDLSNFTLPRPIISPLKPRQSVLSTSFSPRQDISAKKLPPEPAQQASNTKQARRGSGSGSFHRYSKSQVPSPAGSVTKLDNSREPELPPPPMSRHPGHRKASSEDVHWAINSNVSGNMNRSGQGQGQGQGQGLADSSEDGSSLPEEDGDGEESHRIIGRNDGEKVTAFAPSVRRGARLPMES